MRVAGFDLAMVALASALLSESELLPQDAARSPPLLPDSSAKNSTSDNSGGVVSELARRISFDAQLRIRYEYVSPFGYGTTASASEPQTRQSDDAVFQRTRLGVRLRPHRQVGGYLQIQDSRIWGEEGAANTTTNSTASTTSAIDNLDLHLGYLELDHLLGERVGDDTLTVYLGRQELSYGDQRLVSPLDWSNVGRVWDAARIVWTPRGGASRLRIDAFASILRDTVAASNGAPTLSNDFTGAPPVPSTASEDAIDDQQEFHGIYLSYVFHQPPPPAASGEKPILGKQSIDVYGFYRRLADSNLFRNEAGQFGTVNEFTGGGLVKGAIGRLDGAGSADYSFEGACQGGDYAGDDIHAFGLAVTGGYTIPPRLLGELKLRAGVEFDYGSGDSRSGDGVRGTFDPLFPYGHSYQGFEDVFSWKNGQDLALKLAAENIPVPGLKNPLWAEAQYHFFWLSQPRDGWFNAGLTQIRRDPTGNSGNEIGQELDLHLKYTILKLSDPAAPGPEKRLWLWLGYCRFMPGDYVSATGLDPARDFAYTQIQMDI